MTELISREQTEKEIDEFFRDTAGIVPEGFENTLTAIEYGVKNLVKMQETACNLDEVIKQLEAHRYWHAVEIVRAGVKSD